MEKRFHNRLNFGLSFLISFLLLIPLLWYGLGEDQGLYSYSAWVWRNWGHAPYAYCFDQNFPGIFLIHYFVQSVFGESVTAFRFFDLIWQTATALMVYLVTAKIFKKSISGLLASAFYSISYVNLGPWNTGQRDGFLLLTYLICFWLFMEEKQEKRALIRALISGLLLGFAFMLKPVAAIAGLIFLALIFKTEKRKYLSSLVFLAACPLPMLLVIAYYWRIGALKDMYEALILFNFKVYSSALVFDLKGMINGITLKSYLLSNCLILLGGILLYIQRKKIPDDSRVYATWLLLIFLGSYLGYLAQSKYYFYQQAPVWGLLCLLGAGGWSLTIDFIDEKWPIQIKTRTFIITFLLILCTIFLIKPFIHEYLVKALRVSPREGQRLYPFYDVCLQAGNYVDAHSKPGDKLQVWGGGAIVNYLARKESPSRFSSTLYFILRPGPNRRAPLQKNFGQELLDAARKDPPLYFIVELLPHPVFGIESDKQVLVADYPEIWAFVTANYSLETKISFMEIYRRKQ